MEYRPEGSLLFRLHFNAIETAKLVLESENEFITIAQSKRASVERPLDRRFMRAVYNVLYRFNEDIFNGIEQDEEFGVVGSLYMRIDKHLRLDTKADFDGAIREGFLDVENHTGTGVIYVITEYGRDCVRIYEEFMNGND